MSNHLSGVTIYADYFPTNAVYPFSLNVLRQTPHLDFDAPISFFVGENGSGKSTLLQALVRASGIHIWQERKRNRLEVNPHEDKLHYFLSLAWANGPVPGAYFGSDTFRDFVLALDEWAVADPGQLAYFGGESLVTRSHGQSLMAYFEARYRIAGLYFLDEPETALSPRSQIKLLDILAQRSAEGQAQFIIATHSPILLSAPNAVIFSFDHSPLKRISYAETEHYQVYKAFMAEQDF